MSQDCYNRKIGMVFVSLYSICSRKYLMVYTGTVLVLSGKYPKMFYPLQFLFSSSFDGHDEESSAADGRTKDSRSSLQDIPAWLSSASPDEFLVS